MPARILLVDDDPGIRLLLRIALERAGYSVSEATDGDEALAALPFVRPDLIILDWMMPGVSGSDVMDRMRVQGRSTPTLILTGYTEQVREEKRKEARGVLAKPVAMAKLLAVIAAAVSPDTPLPNAGR